MSIKLDNLTKKYGKQTIVNQVNLEIESGELFVLLGASGSGKSTILRMIAGLTPTDGGQIWLHGHDVTRLTPQKRDTGFVFQNYSLFQHMTVAQNIAFSLNVRRVARQEKQRRVTELLDLIDLRGYENRLPHQLSGGQQQRVAVARALAHQPRVLLLDEPFGALDVKIRTQLRRNLRDIQQRLGVTTILVTHDQEEAFDVADRIGILEHGNLLEVGAPAQLYRRPQHPYTASFLGTAHLLPAQRNSHYVYVGDAKLPALPYTAHLEGQPVTLMFRPEDVQITLNQQSLNGHTLGMGSIESLAFAGMYERATIRLQAPFNLAVDAIVPPDKAQTLAVGKAVYIGLQDFHLLATSR